MLSNRFEKVLVFQEVNQTESTDLFFSEAHFYIRKKVIQNFPVQIKKAGVYYYLSSKT